MLQLCAQSARAIILSLRAQRSLLAGPTRHEVVGLLRQENRHWVDHYTCGALSTVELQVFGLDGVTVIMVVSVLRKFSF